ncbi:MAG: CoA pyrophosphatase [Desulfocapsaceae bacterium]|nr:CoA pyrophosphatase [Desulfocapsaceae bacterium]
MNNHRFAELRERLASPHDILGREEYYCSAVLVPLINIDTEEHLLFEKRAAHIRQGGEICFPGGHCDRDKDTGYLQTALRETHEELGIDQSMVSIIGQLDTLVSPRGIIVECFLGILDIDSLKELQLDEREVAKVFTVPVSWFLENPPEIYHTRVETQSSYVDEHGKQQILLPVEELGLPPRYKNNRSQWTRKVFVYKYGPEVIWGLTAAIVENLVNKLFQADRRSQIT